MGQREHAIPSNIVAVVPDHDAAERMVRQLHVAGIPMGDLSIIGRGSQTTEEPVGFVSASDYATAGAATGAWFGGLLGLCSGCRVFGFAGNRPHFGRRSPRGSTAGRNRRARFAGTALGSLTGAAHRLGLAQGKSAQVRNSR